MKIPKLRLVLLTFLPSVFSCFVVVSRTSEQTKQTVGSFTPTATVTPTPEPTATPSPTYTSTPSNQNHDSTECESIVPSLCAKSRTDQPAPDENSIEQDTSKPTPTPSPAIFSQLQLENEKLGDIISFAAYAIHRARNEGRISIGGKGGTFILGDIKINVTSDITDPGASSSEQYYQQLYSSFITITFLKMNRPLSVTFQPKGSGSDSYTLRWIQYEGEQLVDMCCAIYTP